MKSVPKLIRRYVGILLLSCVLFLVLNVVLLYLITTNQKSNSSPWKTAVEVADALQQTGDGTYTLPEALALELAQSNVWAIFIDNETNRVGWQTEYLPETIPLSYTLCDIAALTRGYIDGYPTFTGAAKNGLVVLGYPKDSFWKHMWPSWDYTLIANLPKTVLSVLAINAALLVLIYVVANAKLLKSVRPLANGIQSLPLGEPVHIPEKGLLSELALNINKTSEILQSQLHQLRRKETARANWIAGVSHDIRTPLSMVMGYAGQLAEDPLLPDTQRQKATVIAAQSERMRNLINDLNLASKLEYNMQPLHLKKENLIALVRQVIVDFINTDLDNHHPITWDTAPSLTRCTVTADKALIKRAINNLIQNSIRHNPQGCAIHITLAAQNKSCTITVDDDGKGATAQQITSLDSAPHYMVCDETVADQRHGLGLLIVKQIAAAHGGTTTIGHSPYGGFRVEITLPTEE